VSASALEGATGSLVCLFELAGRTFGVDIGRAREARVLDDYTVVPLAPPQLIGMMNLRGAIIPIVDLRVLLGLPASEGTIHALVVEANAVRVGLAVDRVVGVESLDESLEPGEDTAETAGLQRGRLRRGDDTVPILDVGKIVESLT
jgi:purine-binding chemotaxis protein CheW